MSCMFGSMMAYWLSSDISSQAMGLRPWDYGHGTKAMGLRPWD